MSQNDRGLKAWSTRIGSALAAPVAAMSAADSPNAEGRASGDCIKLLLATALVLEVHRFVIGGWMARDGDWQGAAMILLMAARDRLTVPIALLFAGSLLLTIVARGGWRLSSNADLIAVALVPFVFVELMHSVAVWCGIERRALGTRIGYLWAAGLVCAAWVQTRKRRDLSPPVSGAREGVAMSSSQKTWSARAGGAMVVLLVGVFVINGEDACSNYAQLRPIHVGEQAPDFAATEVTADGQLAAPFSMSSTRGSVVILDFWATWCEPCRISMPALEDLANRYAEQGLRILSISIEGKAATVEARHMIDELAPSLELLMDSGRGAQLYNVTTIPHMVILDRAGAVHSVFRGGHLRSDLEDAIRSLLPAESL